MNLWYNINNSNDMPKNFDKCVRENGKVRTINPKKGMYMHICYKDGKSYPGEVKKTKDK